VRKVAKRKRTRKPSKARQPLRSLRVSPSFREFVLDQLADVPDLRSKAMFGGVGLYSGEHFFGIVASDVLYLKADDSTRAGFEQAGGQPFMPYPDRSGTTQYYSVPIGVLESAPDVMQWVKRAIAVARIGASSAARRTRVGASRRSR
jgi:DNA transformation protein